jgi:hypothetical protein
MFGYTVSKCQKSLNDYACPVKPFLYNTLSPSPKNIEIATSEKLQFLFALNVKLKPFYLNIFLCSQSATNLHTNAILYCNVMHYVH